MLGLKDHPFAIEAYFDFSLVFTFAISVNDAKKLIPTFLEPDTFNNEHAFIAVAMVKTKNLRPKGFPEWFGRNFFLTGYRVFVRYHNQHHKHLRGLYILKSETDSKWMSVMGNIFSSYKYETGTIQVEEFNKEIKINSTDLGINAHIIRGNENTLLPASSPFTNWQEARKFAGPLPFTFTAANANKSVLIIEGVRNHWQPMPVIVLNADFKFINDIKIPCTLANAFIIDKVPYYWKKGRKEML